MDVKELPIVDWKLSLKLAGNKEDLANELLGILLQSFPDELAAIKQHYTAQNYAELLKRVHKLHGAICYSGLPRLKHIMHLLETDLKNNNTTQLDSLMAQFEISINELMTLDITAIKKGG